MKQYTQDLIARLIRAGQNPMWADHCEISKTTATRSAFAIQEANDLILESIEALTEAEKALPEFRRTEDLIARLRRWPS